MDNNNRNILRNRIIEAASKLLLNHSCKQITMDVIAKEMGISKRTIYEIFSDKEMLLEKCIVHIIEKDDSIEQFKHDVNDNFLITLSKFSDLHSSESFKLRCASTKDISKYYPDVYNNYFLPRNMKLIEIVRELLNNSKAKGYIHDYVNIDIVIVMLAEMINSIICEKVFFENNYDKEEIITHTLFIYLRGMATSKAIEEYDEYAAKKQKLNKCINK